MSAMGLRAMFYSNEPPGATPLFAYQRARVSEGEMVAALQQVFGSYTELPVF
jgi:hypothetical protein